MSGQIGGQRLNFVRPEVAALQRINQDAKKQEFAEELYAGIIFFPKLPHFGFPLAFPQHNNSVIPTPDRFQEKPGTLLSKQAIIALYVMRQPFIDNNIGGWHDSGWGFLLLMF